MKMGKKGLTTEYLFAILKNKYQTNARTRTSTIPPERRELLAGVKQRKGEWELTSERLPQIPASEE